MRNTQIDLPPQGVTPWLQGKAILHAEKEIAYASYVLADRNRGENWLNV